jgi:predicted RNA binding protein YcfA (HicA-like mRNA interferase family)
MLRPLVAEGRLDAPKDCRGNPGMKLSRVLLELARDGWDDAGRRGNYLQLKHPMKLRLITLGESGNDDLGPGTLSSIVKQAGFKDRRQE